MPKPEPPDKRDVIIELLQQLVALDQKILAAILKQSDIVSLGGSVSKPEKQ